MRSGQRNNSFRVGKYHGETDEAGGGGELRVA